MKKWFAVVLFALFTLPVGAFAGITEGVEYTRIPIAVPVETGKKIEVREFFWYGCPHCFDLEPTLEHWVQQMPRNAQFVRTPAVFNERWAVHGRAYYAFEMLGITNKMHGALFNALHVEKKPLYDAESLAAFVAEHGGDRKAFLDAYNSFGMQQTISRAAELARSYGIDSVPVLFVDGKYMTNASMAGGFDKIPGILNELIRKAAAERARKK